MASYMLLQKRGNANYKNIVWTAPLSDSVTLKKKCYLPIKDDNGWSDITASDFFMYKGKHYFAYRDYKNIYIYEGKFPK